MASGTVTRDVIKILRTIFDIQDDQKMVIDRSSETICTTDFGKKNYDESDQEKAIENSCKARS